MNTAKSAILQYAPGSLSVCLSVRAEIRAPCGELFREERAPDKTHLLSEAMSVARNISRIYFTGYLHLQYLDRITRTPADSPE